MYYREFGIPARIARCYSVADIEKQVKKYNGKKNCYASVYVFDDSKDKPDGRANYDSAMVDTIWFDFDHKKDVEKCLKDVRKFIRRFCKPKKIIPRIYLTGGKGFQMNIDFHSPVDLPEHVKRPAIQEYLRFLKKKYHLSTLDDICVQNSVSCMRRVVNTKHMTGEVYCTQFSVEEIMDNKNDMDSFYVIAKDGRPETIPSQKSKKALRRFVEFVCDTYDVKHTVSNSVDFLYNEISKSAGAVTTKKDYTNEFIKPVRPCVQKLIDACIQKGHSHHEHNNIIATELVSGGYVDADISFIFKSIYNEPAGDYGWYSDNPREGGRQIRLIRQKALNRYSKDKLIRANVCTSECNLCCE